MTAGPGWGRARVALAIGALLLGAGAAPTVRVAAWEAVPLGPLDLSGEWHRYPPARTAFRQPPAIVLDDGRRAVHLATGGEAMRIGRNLTIDLSATPWLSWEWKALVLPARGDVRDSRRNDQAGRVLVAFEGMKGIQYVWDTTAPVGVEVAPDELSLFQRVLVVVRSGPRDLDRWCRERRNVDADYRRLFGGPAPRVKLVGLESHSNDTGDRTAVRFRSVQFDAR
jgi:hypothetical protein